MLNNKLVENQLRLRAVTRYKKQLLCTHCYVECVGIDNKLVEKNVLVLACARSVSVLVNSTLSYQLPLIVQCPNTGITSLMFVPGPGPSYHRLVCVSSSVSLDTLWVCERKRERGR